MASVFGAVGWLYLLRRVGAFDVGPRVAGALPLQQLAGGDAQPLLRMAVVWLPAGAIAAIAVPGRTVLASARRTAAIALVTWAVLVVAGAGSDAAAISEGVLTHLPDQLVRAGTWVAVALMAAGSLIVRRR